METPIIYLERRQLEHCQTENQRWAVTLTNLEQEINQLLTLLEDVLAQYNHQNLRHRAIDYYRGLNRLKVWFNRLRMDLCEKSDCASSNLLPCEKPRFGRQPVLPSQFADLSDEFIRTKTGCYQFLSGLVQLNLL
ncbi:hypothetical protein ACFQ4C_11925 [Larkinella insperata]|uniref:Uncharacterized protein n=1 Tax=Larkinella insperata TaxID=332158 RepID=A0ABW3QIT8_9BACT|nr:hypothetical protein [Larkinella insperata]